MKDPWSEINPPEGNANPNTRRVSAEHRWDWFRGKDSLGRALLILQTRGKPTTADFPTLKGIDIRVSGPRTTDHGFIVIALRESDAWEPFRRLCDDLVEFSNMILDEDFLPRALCDRLHTWRRLLGAKRRAQLSIQEQRGLISELTFLRDKWLPHLQELSAVEGWTGPTDASQDFRHEYVAVEIKSHSPSSPFVFISSETQLWFDGSLFLSTYPIVESDEQNPKATSLYDTVDSLRESLEDDKALALLDTRLLSAHYEHTDAYKTNRFEVREPSLFRVSESFPRIRFSDLDQGIRDVKYQLNLDFCSEFEASDTDLGEVLNGNA